MLGNDLLGNLQSRHWLTTKWLTQSDAYLFVYSVGSLYSYVSN